MRVCSGRLSSLNSSSLILLQSYEGLFFVCKVLGVLQNCFFTRKVICEFFCIHFTRPFSKGRPCVNQLGTLIVEFQIVMVAIFFLLQPWQPKLCIIKKHYAKRKKFKDSCLPWYVNPQRSVTSSIASIRPRPIQTRATRRPILLPQLPIWRNPEKMVGLQERSSLSVLSKISLFKLGGTSVRFSK